MTLQNAYEEFMLEQQVRGNSAKTQEYYKGALGKFLTYAGPDFDPAAVTLKMLRNYAAQMRKGSLSSTTIQSYIRALRAFLRWCYNEEYMPVDLSEKFPLPRAKKDTIHVLTDEEINRLMGSFNLKDEVQLRNYCICSLMLDSGLRLNEVVTLTLEHLHITDGYAIVDGKGNKQRMVPLGNNTRKVLTRYLRRRPACATMDRVFVLRNGQPIKQTTVRQLFKKLKHRVGIPRLHPHLLRHTFATRYLMNGADQYSLQEILGHTSPAMTQKYVHLTQQQNVKRFSNFSPQDTLKRKTA